MSVKFIVLTVAAMLVVASVASPLSKDKLIISKATVGLAENPPKTAEKLRVRAGRSVPLSEDQRELMSRQLLQALSEIMQREDCVSDYQGWVDFGRRSTT